MTRKAKRDAAPYARTKFLNRLSEVMEAADWGQRADIDDPLRLAYVAFKEFESIKYEAQPSFQD
jgi:hypothetical protein